MDMKYSREELEAMAKTVYGVNKNYVDIMVEIKHETTKALLMFDGATEAWIPKSQIEGIDKGNGEGKEVIVTIPEWLAQDKGFI